MNRLSAWMKRAVAFRRNRRGSILMEVALGVPVILLLFAGGFEVGRYVLLEMKVSRVATTLTDLVSQTDNQIFDSDIDGLVKAVPHIGKPFTLDNSNTQIIITAARANSSNTPIICWQTAKMGNLGKTSDVGSPGGVANLPTQVATQEGDTVIVAEVYYDYAPFVFDTVMQARHISSSAVFRPRLAKLSALQPGDVSSC